MTTTGTTTTGTTTTGTPSTAELAEQVAGIVLAVPGVAGLHGGAFGEIATYLPGRRVEGIRIGPDLCMVHIVARYPCDLRAVADAVHARVATMVSVPVQVTIEDLDEHPLSDEHTEAAP